MNPCCCMSLRTGSMVVGVLGIIGNVFGLIVMAAGLAGVIYIQNNPGEVKNVKVTQDQLQVLVVVFAISVVLYAIQLTLSVILVVGINKSSQTLLRTWVVFQSVGLALLIVYIVVTNVVSTGEYSLGNNNATSIVGIVFNTYFIAVVYAYLQELRRNHGGIQIYPPANAIITSKPIGPV